VIIKAIIIIILVVERNSIGSQAIEGGNFHISQNDALWGMEVGDSCSQTFNVFFLMHHICRERKRKIDREKDGKIYTGA